MRALCKLTIADMKQFVRDRAALFWNFAFPILFIALFGLVFGNVDTGKLKVGLAIEDNSAVAISVGQALDHLPMLDVQRGSVDEQTAALRRGQLRAVVVLDKGAGDLAAQGRPVSLRVLYDPSQQSSAQLMLSVIRQSVANINRDLSGQPDLLEVHEETLQARRLRNIDYLVPGIVAMSLMQLGLYSSYGIVQQRQNLILRRLAATPLPRGTVILSQVILRLIIALGQTILLLATGRLLYGVEMTGNWAMLALLVIFGSATFIAMGFAVASFTRTIESFEPVVQVLNFPMMLISGIFFPIDTMPEFVRPLVMALPLTYLGDAMRQIMVDGTPLVSLGVDALILAGYLIVTLAIASRYFRWE
ncbi:MAG: ABC transporter permease [Chloroflexota bacterium]|nr:MAG: ABC transporter permease [Chloroflexota bacterium]